MMIDSKLIEKYLNDEMPENEKLKFELRIKSDSKLFNEVEFRKGVGNAINESDIIELRESLSSVIYNRPTLMGFETGKFFFWQLAAAVALMLIVVKLVFFSNIGTKDLNVLFSEYYQPYPSLQSVRASSNMSEINIMYNQALADYGDKNFASAEKNFNVIISIDSTEIMAEFYLAITQIEQNNYVEAQKYLDQLVKHKQHIFYEQSVWYLALVYLKQKKVDEAKNLLKLIVSENYYNSETAIKLLKDIN